MKVNPGRSICWISRRLVFLCQTGYDTKRHVRGCAFSVEDRFIFGKADGFRNHFHNPGSQVKVAHCILQQGVANRYISSYLIAVQRHLIKHEGQFVDCPAHFRPDRFRHGSSDGLASLSRYASNANAIQQFGVAIHILGNQFQKYYWDFQIAAGDCSGGAFHGTNF